MREKVRNSFHQLVTFLPAEMAIMPLARWNESVLRYFFCRHVAAAYPDVQQHVECNRIDLVLRQATASAFVEFKLYSQPSRVDPYSGKARGYKGGPSPKNVLEFQSCVDYLHNRESIPGLSKFIILVYADTPERSRKGMTYSHYYDEYRHSDKSVPLQLLESSSPVTDGIIIRAKLYELMCHRHS